MIGVAAFNSFPDLMMLVEHHRGDPLFCAAWVQQSPNCWFVLWLGIAAGIGGIVIGLCLGSGLAFLLEALFPALQSLLGAELMTQYFISYLPVGFVWLM